MNTHPRSGMEIAPVSHATVDNEMNVRSGVPTPDTMKRAFSLFPSGVVIAATVDASGARHGFTASAFTPLSLDPPMVLLCLNVSAQCFTAFSEAKRFAISVLRPEHRDHAMRFATRGGDKFEMGRFRSGPFGMPQLDDAMVNFECSVAGRFPGGDHIILTGLVEHVCYRESGSAMVHFMRSFRHQAI
ncbi:flavin reductase family protein [Corticibacterium sp. UT-5YL-CI-8]|nr:flavin reductase family protein [Tianweitania sp. UT-5YL-CI-8]